MRTNLKLLMLQTDTIPDGQVFTKTANLKGEVVAVKKIQLQRLEITRKILLELKQARNMHLDFFCLHCYWVIINLYFKGLINRLHFKWLKQVTTLTK